mmetsp:Transcript_26612/g.26987  ORF Transcript_26612/g.26987 Transcript_26612/m.26987 type:complete len:88 (-) Transcript_26612:1569-1832(-)
MGETRRAQKSVVENRGIKAGQAITNAKPKRVWYWFCKLCDYNIINGRYKGIFSQKVSWYLTLPAAILPVSKVSNRVSVNISKKIPEW